MIDRYNRNVQEMVPPGRTHEEWLEEQRKEREVWKRENERIRAERLQRLDDEREAKKREAEAEQEAQFAPVKRIEMHKWLAAHPGMSEDDFNRHAWPHLKEVIASDTREAMIAREIEAQRRRQAW